MVAPKRAVRPIIAGLPLIFPDPAQGGSYDPPTVGIASLTLHLVEDLLTQPIVMVAGSDAGSLWNSTGLHARVRSNKKLVIVDGGTHMDFYDVPKYVDRAVAEAAPFFNEHIAAQN
jgi:fermentation-respiration switch protein FrsA (DUF1100 family)